MIALPTGWPTAALLALVLTLAGIAGYQRLQTMEGRVAVYQEQARAAQAQLTAANQALSALRQAQTDIARRTDAVRGDLHARPIDRGTNPIDAAVLERLRREGWLREAGPAR